MVKRLYILLVLLLPLVAIAPSSVLFKRRLGTPAAGGGGGFDSPDDINGLSLWLHGNLALDDSDEVATWTDNSPDGNNATQGTAANRPIYKLGEVNGLDIVRFSGLNDADRLDGTLDAALAQEGTFFIVARETSLETSGYLFSFDNDDAPFDLGFGFGGNSIEQWDGSSAIEIGTISDSVFNIYALRKSATGPATATWKNGTAGGTRVSSKNSTSANFFIGNDSGGNPYDGDIAEIIVYDTALSTANLNNVGNYLETKYGLTWTDVP